MRNRSVLTLAAVAAVALVSGCNADDQLMGIKRAQQPPADVISDGAHGGNRDFFFLPPLVPLASASSGFELGNFDNTLRPILTVEICELVVAGTGLPADDSPCRAVDATHPLTRKFNAGSVQLVNLPLRQNGWWTLLGLPPDGFYYVLWNTQQSNLVLSKYYRIKVFVDGASDPIGYADVDPMGSLREWKYSNTGQVIQMVDDVLLPIPFRIEKGAFCVSGSTLCKSVIVGNDNPNGPSTIVQLQGDAGSIAGAEFKDGWLPADGPQSVVVTISRVPGGTPHADGSRSIPCHVGLLLVQFDGCFRFTTTPTLKTVDGNQFVFPVRVAVCYVLHGNTTNPLTDFAELWASGPNEETREIIPEVTDFSLLTNHDCKNADPVIVMTENPVARFAQVGWRKLKDAFTVPTAYAVDGGLGGFLSGFTTVGPAIGAHLEAEGPTDLGNQPPDSRYILKVLLLGRNHHSSESPFVGINGLPVKFSVTSDQINGTVESHLTPVGTVTPTSVESITTNADEMEGEASVIWHLPPTPGTYHLAVSGPVTGEDVVFTATVASLPDLYISSGAITLNVPSIASTGGLIHLSNWTAKNQGLGPSAATGIQYYLSTDATITTADRFLGGSDLPALASGATASFDGPTFSIHPPLTVGTYYVGILVDNANQVAESNEANNYVSASFDVKPAIDFEHYPAGVGVCDGAGACPVTDEFSRLGVVFSSDVGTPSLCRTSHGPVGEGSNYGVTEQSNADCSGWNTGTVTMSFASNPATIEFQLGGNNDDAEPFAVTAVDGLGNVATVIVWYSFAYQDAGGIWFRRETRRVTSPNGIASITVPRSSAVHWIDNLWITP
jgi:hypothetical protein